MCLILLDCSTGEVIKIRLTEEEMADMKNHEDTEEFIMEHLEKRYHFRLSDCSWMLADELMERTYNM